MNHPSQAPVATAWLRLVQNRTSVVGLVALALFALFSVTVPRFLTQENVFNMLREVALLGIFSSAMTFLFVAGEIDISIGSIYGFLTVVMGILAGRHGWNPWLAMLAVIPLGALIGVNTGCIVTRIGIPAFIVTLAELVGFRSATLLISGEQPSVADGAGSFYGATGGYIGAHFPALVLWTLAVVAISALVLAKTRFGYHVYATGGDSTAAASWGIPTGRVTLICFVFMGATCGLAAALLFGWLQVAAPATGTGLEFSVIAAVILGGTALQGGRGSVLGSLIGACMIEILNSGLILLGLSQQWKDVTTGSLILIASTLDWILRNPRLRPAPA
jgi:ribose transport system permease protein